MEAREGACSNYGYLDRMSIMNICSLWVIRCSNSYSIACRERINLKSSNRMFFKFSVVWLFVSYAPDSKSDTPLFSGLSGKKMALLVGIIVAGGFFGIQAMFGFPIKDLIRKDVTNEVKVITKAEGTCVVEASDHQPRGIPHCPYVL